MAARVETRVRIERKDANLPRYLVLPPEAAAALALDATTPAQLEIEGTDVGRRNVKRWRRGSDRWFVDLTEAQCRKAGVDAGDEVAVAITRLREDVPEALRALLDADAGTRAAWARLSPARQRGLADHVREAKRAETRRRRAAAVLSDLRND
ncbi:MAG: YdeI/OmpD-associated family protein [Pseudomonadales bacterium]|nr:YdeI/OmpD-associated family protein [Pseudomonadales bacterium]